MSAKPPVNEFEFLRGMPFGPYMPVDSPVHRLDPRARILLVTLLVAALTIARHPLGMIIGFAAILVCWRVARVPFEPLLRGWRAALPFLLILALLQVVLRAGGRNEPPWFTIGPLVVSAADVWSGASLLARFFSLMAVLGLAAAVMSESELTHGLEALLKPLALLRVPVSDFVTIIQVMLRYFPLLAQSAERIAKAQASRGADWRPSGWNLVHRVRQVTPLIVPLFVTSLRRAESMALAMDARGYGSARQRTSLVVLRYSWRDLLAGLLGVLLAAAIVAL